MRRHSLDLRRPLPSRDSPSRSTSSPRVPTAGRCPHREGAIDSGPTQEVRRASFCRRLGSDTPRRLVTGRTRRALTPSDTGPQANSPDAFSDSTSATRPRNPKHHTPWRGGRVAECTGLENRRTARYREFESPPLRSFSHVPGDFPVPWDRRNRPIGRGIGTATKNLSPGPAAGWPGGRLRQKSGTNHATHLRASPAKWNQKYERAVCCLLNRFSCCSRVASPICLTRLEEARSKILMRASRAKSACPGLNPP
jgi:hypothetical protein